MTEQEKIRINELVFKSLEGSLSQEECRELELWIAADAAIRARYYSRCVDICLGLSKMQQIISDPLHMTDYLQKMAEYERTAEVIPFQRACHEPRPVEIKAGPVSDGRRSRLSLYTALTAIAALVLMLLYVHFAPRPVSSQDVAILVDSINAKWLDPASSLKPGDRLWTNQGPSTLKEGIISICYDDGVEAVIQAPAEYELLTATEIAVHYGRLYAKVSEAGKGFTVKTRNSRIIDLGTEFGVVADVQGDTQLHVFKGRTTLIAGGQKKNVWDVIAGHAMKVDDAQVREISLENTAFARKIDSDSGLIWNGQTAIDLADIVGGGDGLGGGHSAATASVSDIFRHPLLGPGELLAVPGNPCIEGVFVPNGAHGPIPLTRDRGIMWNAPVTDMRQKIGYLKFDISGTRGNRTGAQIAFNVSSWEGKKITLRVYGLRDGGGDLWDESKVCYNNAPGFRASPLGRYVLDLDAVENLGVFLLDGLGFKTSSLSTLNLDSWIRNDTNGLLTLILVCDSGDPGDDWKMTTREGDSTLAPKLILPYATGQSAVEITTAQGRGADTYLSNDNQHDNTGPDSGHGAEGVIRIRDYSKDAVYISNSPVIQLMDRGLIRTQYLTDETTAGHSIIGMRVISGITFDLKRIGQNCPDGLSFKSFTAKCGVAGVVNNSAKAGFYVLVDGREAFSRVDMSPQDGTCAIEVPLTGQESYLTLVAADGTDRKNARDWAYFARPRLNME